MRSKFVTGAFGQSIMCVLVILFLWTVGSTLPNSLATTDESIEARAWKRIRAGAMLVDARTPREFSRGHLPGAVNIPYDQLAARIEEIGQDKDRDIVLYCRSGRRSGIGKRTLESMGYTNVLNAGGYVPMLKAK